MSIKRGNMDSEKTYRRTWPDDTPPACSLRPRGLRAGIQRWARPVTDQSAPYPSRAGHSVRMWERQRVSNHHQVTPRPTRDHHAHRNRHPLRAEHGPHDRRHRREEAPVRAAVRRHEEDQRAQGVRNGPDDDHAEGREQQGYE